MTRKSRVVLFSPVGCRIVITNRLRKYAKMRNAMINPDLQWVKGIPPHFWTRQDGRIVEMSRPRKLARLAQIDAMTRIQWGPRPLKPLIIVGTVCAILGVISGWSAKYWGLVEWLMK